MPLLSGLRPRLLCVLALPVCTMAFLFNLWLHADFGQARYSIRVPLQALNTSDLWKNPAHAADNPEAPSWPVRSEPAVTDADNWRVAFKIVPVGFATSVPKRVQGEFFSSWYGEIAPGPRFSLLAMQNGQPVLRTQARVVPVPQLTDVVLGGPQAPYDADQLKRIATGEQTVETLFADLKNTADPLEAVPEHALFSTAGSLYFPDFTSPQCRLDRIELAAWLQDTRRNTLGFSLVSLEAASRYRTFVERYSSDYVLPPSLVYAIMRTESSFNPKARSVANALGLMQVVPKTAGGEVHAFLTGKYAIPGRELLFTPEQNIRYGTAYLYLLHNRYFNEVSNHISRELCIIAAYNGGPGAVLRSFGRNREKAIAKINSLSPDQLYNALVRSLPSQETRDYVVKVVEARDKFRHTGNSF
ncbi:MAG: transglycosylase SLT domain-containing protein [Deltaproteobacteria bacterium]|nr:transglycosylase SLT domain-containing protein [Deltaproteobacteria bacterium]